MKTLTILRWGVGGQETHDHEFDNNAVMEILADGNVAVLDSADEGANTVAFFAGIAEARWTE